MKPYQRWLLCLYPQTWRARYEEEFLAVLEACPFSLWMLWDVCLGAIDAHVHCETLIGRMMPSMNKLRRTSIIIFCAYIGFVVAGLGFGKMVEYDDFSDLLNHNAPVSVAYYALYTGAFVALLAVLVGGLPLAVAAARSAIAARRWRLLSLFAVPPIALAVWIKSFLIAEVLDPHPAPVLARPVWERVLDAGLVVGLFWLAAIASTAAVCIVIVRSNINEKLFRFARIPAIIATLAMVVMFVAVAAYGLAANAVNPSLFTENNGLIATNTTVSFGLILAIMALATIIAIAALIRGRRPDTAVPSTPAIASQPAS
jgi:MFS family permease